MNCIACKGTGHGTKPARKIGKQVIVDICYDCKGTGLAVELNKGIAIYDDGVYGPNDVLHYRNTGSNKKLCRIEGFEVHMSFMKNTDGYPLNHYPLKDVLFTGVDTVTGAAVCRPLWRSITLKRKNALFETKIVERI